MILEYFQMQCHYTEIIQQVVLTIIILIVYDVFQKHYLENTHQICHKAHHDLSIMNDVEIMENMDMEQMNTERSLFLCRPLKENTEEM